MATFRTLTAAAALSAVVLAPAVTSPAQAAAPAPVTVKKKAKTVTMEERVVKIVNAKRKARGCKPVTMQVNLRKSARTHTALMVKHKKMDHHLPKEPALGARITKGGYKNWRMVAENIARGFASPNDVMRAWMNSPGHRKNILNCKFKHIGVGVQHAHGQFWWTQHFGVK